MWPLFDWLKRFNPFAWSARQLLDYYVEHPEELFDPLTQRWTDVSRTMGLFEALSSLPDPGAYLDSLPKLDTSYPDARVRPGDIPSYDRYISYIRTKASREAERENPEQYAISQRIRHLYESGRRLVLAREMRRPLTPQQQVEFDSDWSLLSDDYRRRLTQSLLALRPNNLSLSELYDLFYDDINYVHHGHRGNPQYFDDNDAYTLLIHAINRPLVYWLYFTRDNIDEYFAHTSQKQLVNVMERISNVSRSVLESMTKRGLIRLYDTIIIDRYNNMKEQCLRALRKEMEDGIDNMWRDLVEYLSVSDLTSVLDEFSIEHANDIERDTAIDLIGSYFDLYDPVELLRSSIPMTKRKLE